MSMLADAKTLTGEFAGIALEGIQSIAMMA